MYTCTNKLAALTRFRGKEFGKSGIGRHVFWCNAITATATKLTRRDICKFLYSTKPVVILRSPMKPIIVYIVSRQTAVTQRMAEDNSI